ncbi:MULTISPECIES: restriction endonuclease subunit S [unclassified Microbulbifer]|uniref:restriction endonuclease subunit S n=1 Tax=unclassified Microbulbifer TaxID=2619833 RepID=UPI0027E43DCF|nr:MULTISPECIES: restriction endonuclease subunit S [unclassified Microbulbifer]
MNSDWKLSKLGELLETIIDYRGKTPPKSPKGIPTLTAANVKSGRIDLSKVSYVSRETYDRWTTRGFPEGGDVLITTEAPVGEVAPFPIDQTYLITRRVIALRAKKGVLDSKYLLYALLSPKYRDALLTNVRGSTVSRVLKTDITGLDLLLPEYEYQRSVAKIFHDIDSKIDLNRKTNQTLEQIAQTLFKSWFVDFEPVRAKVVVREHFERRAAEQGEPLPAPGALEQAQNTAAAATIAGLSFDPADIDGTRALLEAKLAGMGVEQREQLMETAALFPDEFSETELGKTPAGWNVTTLDELLEFNPRRILKKGAKAPYLDMKNVPTQGHLAEDVYQREFGSGTKFINGDTLLARITPCLENGKTAYVDFLDAEQVGWGSTEFIVLRPKGGRPLSLGYLMARLESFRSLAIQSMTGTSGRQRANAKALAMARWLDYPLDLLERFDDIAGAYLRMAKNNGIESKALSQLRDTLLPKLLSGEIQLNPEPVAEAS